jgi:hypothetical protein
MNSGHALRKLQGFELKHHGEDRRTIGLFFPPWRNTVLRFDPKSFSLRRPSRDASSLPEFGFFKSSICSCSLAIIAVPRITTGSVVDAPFATATSFNDPKWDPFGDRADVVVLAMFGPFSS